MEKPRFQPGDRVIRMGPSAPPFGVERFGQYEVERFAPASIDGLYLRGVEGRWNPENFERLPA
jgi:hypothetical protein